MALFRRALNDVAKKDPRASSPRDDPISPKEQAYFSSSNTSNGDRFHEPWESNHDSMQKLMEIAPMIKLNDFPRVYQLFFSRSLEEGTGCHAVKDLLNKYQGKLQMVMFEEKLYIASGSAALLFNSTQQQPPSQADQLQSQEEIYHDLRVKVEELFREYSIIDLNKFKLIYEKRFDEPFNLEAADCVRVSDLLCRLDCCRVVEEGGGHYVALSAFNNKFINLKSWLWQRYGIYLLPKHLTTAILKCLIECCSREPCLKEEIERNVFEIISTYSTLWNWSQVQAGWQFLLNECFELTTRHHRAVTLKLEYRYLPHLQRKWFSIIRDFAARENVDLTDTEWEAYGIDTAVPPTSPNFPTFIPYMKLSEEKSNGLPGDHRDQHHGRKKDDYIPPLPSTTSAKAQAMFETSRPNPAGLGLNRPNPFHPKAPTNSKGFDPSEFKSLRHSGYNASDADSLPPGMMMTQERTSKKATTNGKSASASRRPGRTRNRRRSMDTTYSDTTGGDRNADDLWDSPDPLMNGSLMDLHLDTAAGKERLDESLLSSTEAPWSGFADSSPIMFPVTGDVKESTQTSPPSKSQDINRVPERRFSLFDESNGGPRADTHHPSPSFVEKLFGRDPFSSTVGEEVNDLINLKAPPPPPPPSPMVQGLSQQMFPPITSALNVATDLNDPWSKPVPTEQEKKNIAIWGSATTVGGSLWTSTTPTDTSGSW